jgi:L-lactate dehydrogenase
MGKVGASTAFAMCLDGTPTDLVLVAHHREQAEAEKLDLEHSLPFLQQINITATDSYEAVAGSDLIVVTAGVAQQPGQTRLDLLAANLKVFADIIPKIYAASPQSLVLIVTNPVDILTYAASKMAPFAFGQIFGSGTLLDTARFRFHLSEIFDVNPRSIHAYVLGEHGDHSFPALSAAHISGLKLAEFQKFSEPLIQEAFAKTQNAAYQIIQAKGATFYAIATAIRQLMKNMYSNAQSIVPVSIPLSNQYGVSDMALSLPCVVGSRGVEQIVPIPLSDTETTQFQTAAQVLKDVYQQVKEI